MRKILNMAYSICSINFTRMKKSELKKPAKHLPGASIAQSQL